ncbi:MAG TPA: AAA family ATPase [Kofleriaceae bacterium]|nr:AAA family ATPase [Kofleriaceae bacterium]
MNRDDVALIGRAGEMARLDAVLARVRGGGRGAVVIAGEAGIGKTRLAREVMAKATAAEMLVLHGRAHLDAVELAYAPVHEAYGRLLRGLGDKARGKLVSGLPDLARLFGELAGKTPAPISDPAVERTRLFDAVARLTERLATESPVVIVIDDLQWADSASIGVLAHLARAEVARVLVVATLRGTIESIEGPAAALLAQWRRAGADELTLGRLADRDVDALVATRLGAKTDDAIVANVRTRAGGVPLFVEQLVRALVDQGHVIDAGGRWIIAAGRGAMSGSEDGTASATSAGTFGNLELPPVIRDLVAARLVRLDERDRAIIDALAVAGDRAEHNAIVAATGLGDNDILARTNTLRAAGLMVADDGGYALGHPLIGEVALRALAPELRRRMHLAFARHIENAGGAEIDIDSLARHLRGAGRDADRARTLDVLLAAGGRALALYANEQAVGHLAAAVALCRASTGGAARLGDVLESIGEAWSRLGQAAAAVDAWREAISLVPRERHASLYRRMALVEFDRGRGEAARAAIAAAGEAVGAATPQERTALLEVRLRVAERANDRDELAAVAAELAAHASVDPRAGSMALFARARLAIAEHRLADAWNIALELERVTAGRGEAAMLRAAELAALVAVERWRPTDAIARAEIVEKLGRQLGEPASHMRGIGIHAAAVLHAGRLDECTKLANAARDLARRYEIARGEVRTTLMLAIVAVQRGRDGEAASLLGTSENANVRTTGDRWSASLIAMAVAQMALEGDGRWDVGPYLDALTAAGGDQWLFRQLLAAEVAVRDGRVADAEALAGEARATGDEAGIAVADWIAAHLARARGDLATAIELLTRASRAINADMFRTRALVQLADLASGDDAIAIAREAEAIADRVGLSRYGDRARKRLRELGIRPSTRRAGGGGGTLSARELEVARAYAEGLSSAEVGERLSISQHTAATHLQKIYKRLGVSSRAELTRWLLENE